MRYNPPGIRSNFDNVFRQMLYGNFIQGGHAKINESTRLYFLSDVNTICKLSQYIIMIKIPEFAVTFTRIQIDMNIYSSYNIKKIYRHGHAPFVPDYAINGACLFFWCKYMLFRLNTIHKISYYIHKKRKGPSITNHNSWLFQAINLWNGCYHAPHLQTFEWCLSCWSQMYGCSQNRNERSCFPLNQTYKPNVI